MPIKDLAAQSASLDNDYPGPSGGYVPATLDVEIWVGDPLGSGYEMPATTDVDGVDTANGYASVNVSNDATTWLDADVDGTKTSNPIAFPASTAAYPDTGTHWLLRDPATSAAWDCGAFTATDRVVVDAPGVTPNPVVSIFYNNLTD